MGVGTVSRRTLRGRGAAAIAVALVATLSGCGEESPSGRSSQASPASPAGDTVTLSIKNFAFAPKALQLRVGQTLVVTNFDSTVHTFTAEDGSFDSGSLAQGKSFSYRPTKAGTYPYYCDPHQYMTGTITVS